MNIQKSLFKSNVIHYDDIIMLRNDFSNKVFCELIKEKTMMFDNKLEINDELNSLNLMDLLPHLVKNQILYIRIIPKHCSNLDQTYFQVCINFTFGEVFINKKWYIYDANSSMSILIKLLSPIFMVGLESKIVFNGGFIGFSRPIDLFSALSKYATDKKPYQIFYDDESYHFLSNGNNILLNAIEVRKEHNKLETVNNSEFKTTVADMAQAFNSRFIN